MKVGILTFHHTSNYGAVLQAFALCQFIQSQGHEAEIIDYQPKAANAFYWKAMRFITRSGPLRSPKFDQMSFLRYWKYRKFQSFFRQNLTLSKAHFVSREALAHSQHDYDLVVCGSDQIWSLDTPFRGFDPSFFLDFIQPDSSCRKASYAASCGSTSSFGDKEKEISQLINRIDAIAVRDSNTGQMVRQTCNREATLVLDPTFLGHYETIVVFPKVSRKYLLLYQHGALSKAEENTVRKVASDRSLEIVSVGKNSPLAQHNFVTADPGEWLGLFSQASHIFTNTFHGTIFSLIFRRNFTVFARASKQNKIQDLLGRFSLLHHIVTYNQNEGQAEDFSRDIPFLSEKDYAAIWKKIEYEINVSKGFLLKILAAS